LIKYINAISAPTTTREALTVLQGQKEKNALSENSPKEKLTRHQDETLQTAPNLCGQPTSPRIFVRELTIPDRNAVERRTSLLILTKSIS